jgi:hypothetical protein
MSNYPELKLPYPYYKLYYRFDRKEISKNIKSYVPIIHTEIPPNLSKYKMQKFNSDTYFIIENSYEHTKEINNLTDYFTEPVRVKCAFKNNPSPYKFWHDNKNSILDKTIKQFGYDEENHKNNIPNIREIIYANIRLCNNMYITVIYTILKYFKPKKYLDISAGWGDRLISAILYKRINLYVSCDPNLDLHPYYNEIIRSFKIDKTDRQFMIHPTGFMEAPIEQTNFDIVFSSPPFFDLEIYSNYKDDSYIQFNKENEWINNFLLPSITKAFNLLRTNGHLVLYISGSHSMMNSIHTLLHNKSIYKGIIYFYETKPRAIYVWQKI